MKTIFEEIEEEAEKFDHEVKLGDLITTKIFKAGAKFVYDKCITIVNDLIVENQGLKLYKDNEGTRAIEFAEWVQKSFGACKPLYEGCIRNKCKNTEELYEIFLKEKYD